MPKPPFASKPGASATVIVNNKSIQLPVARGTIGPDVVDIRKLYGEGIERNSVHGSDSPENAEREIRFFFSEIELVG